MRLNLYVPILLGKSNLQKAKYQLGPYLASFYGPVLFVIGVASVILNGLQVVVSAGTEGRGGWMRVVYLVSIGKVITSCSFLLCLGTLLVLR